MSNQIKKVKHIIMLDEDRINNLLLGLKTNGNATFQKLIEQAISTGLNEDFEKKLPNEFNNIMISLMSISTSRVEIFNAFILKRLIITMGMMNKTFFDFIMKRENNIDEFKTLYYDSYRKVMKRRNGI